MTVFLVILAILLLGCTALLASGRPFPSLLRRRGAGSDVGMDGDGTALLPTTGLQDVPGLVEPVATLPPVLLPDAPVAEDVDAVRFGLGLRGYRMDQVDEVLDRLASALDDRDATIRSLRSHIAATQDVER